jgi:uncharacterized protein (DUF2252 family)
VSPAKTSKAGKKSNGAARAPGVEAARAAAVAIDGIEVDRPPRAERRAAGEARRREVPFEAHAVVPADHERGDPIAVIEATSTRRVPELVPIRYGRMMVSPFTYFRGSPAVMAADLASTPATGFTTQICGDAHLLNFGLFASPERSLLFDVNDFDETLPGPWEWDVKRLAASLVIAGRYRRLPKRACRELAIGATRAYCVQMARYSQMSALDVWYSRVDVDGALDQIEHGPAAEASEMRAAIDDSVQRSIHKTSVEAMPKLTEVVDGHPRLIDDPPLITHIASDEAARILGHVWSRYRTTLDPERRVLLDRFEIVDFARKVVGVGSVGTRCFVVLLVSADGRDPLFLQIKEAERSVLEPHCHKTRFANQGERVVIGQRLMQAASDIFLGWTTGPFGHHYYVRQLRDMKGSVRLDRLTAVQLRGYGRLCGWTLARAHARSGDPATLAGYVGDGKEFSQAIGRFSTAYADLNERDHERFGAAIKNGRLFAVPGH